MLKIFTKRKPDWLYEVIPSVYWATGLAAFFYFDSLLGYVAGVVLMFIAFLIWMSRKENN